MTLIHEHVDFHTIYASIVTPQAQRAVEEISGSPFKGLCYAIPNVGLLELDTMLRQQSEDYPFWIRNDEIAWMVGLRESGPVGFHLVPRDRSDSFRTRHQDIIRNKPLYRAIGERLAKVGTHWPLEQVAHLEALNPPLFELRRVLDVPSNLISIERAIEEAHASR
jgi:hypothetical protein